MAAKQIAYGVDARERVLNGVRILNKAVSATLGPKGRNVILAKSWGSPTRASPRTGPRVVWALWVTMDTLAPTSALVRVDLPLLGTPIRATKPQRFASSGTGLVSVPVIGW